MNLVIVQARLGSNRLPGKVLMDFDNDKTLLDVIVSRINLAKKVDKIIIATTKNKNDDAIVDHCKKMNYNYFQGSENDCLERHYQCSLNIEPNSISKIPSDVPFIDPKIIDKVISMFYSTNYDYVSNLHPPTFPDGMDIETFSFNALKESYENANIDFHREHTTPYMWDNPEKFKIGYFKSDQKQDYFNEYRFTIDYIEDYLFLKKVYKKTLINKLDYSWKDLINFVDSNPEIKSINSKYLGSNWYRNHINEIKNLDPQIIK